MKLLIIMAFLFTSSQVLAKSKSGFEIEPYLTATKGSYEFENSYKGALSAIGIGGRVGYGLGPLFFGFDIIGQMPWYSDDDDATEAQTDVSPVPTFDLWLSYGLAAGLKTRLFSLTYTHFFKTDLKAKARYENLPHEDEKINYTYHGTGSKISALIHLSKNVSLGAEIANYTFDKYSVDKATHVLDKASDKGRDELNVTATSLLINYHIDMDIK